MEFEDAVRRRHMVRDFAPSRIPRDVLDRVLEAARHGPSAGFAQGLDLVVLDEEAEVARFWRITDPRGRKRPRRGGPPVIVIPVPNKAAYLDRYSAPDKAGLGLDVEEGWPVRYWDLDAAMAVMLMLLAAVDAELGAWFFGIFHGERELVEWLGVPAGRRPIGALALGRPAPGAGARGSAVSRRRRPLEQVVHRGKW